MKVVRGALGVLAALFVWELLLRHTVIVSMAGYDHPVLGRIQQPGVILSSREGFSVTTINSLGMRASEPADKQAGELRILVVGDSLTAGFEVADGATYCDLLQQTLTQRLNRPVTVINAGRTAASPAFYMHLADYYQRVLQPDCTVIQLDDGDFSGDAFLEGKSFRFVAESGGFRLVAASPVPAPTPPLTRLAGAHPWLQPLGALQGSLRSSVVTAGDKLRPHVEDFAARSRHAEPAAMAAVPAEGAQQPHTYADLVRWSVPRLLKSYAGAVVLYIPDESTASNAIERLVSETVEANGATCLNPRRAFTHAAQTHQPPRGFNNTTPGVGHLNEHGHHLVADQLVAHFTARVTP